MPRNITCYICGTPLKGNSDTFGPHGYEMCRKCWHERTDGVTTNGDYKVVEWRGVEEPWKVKP